MNVVLATPSLLPEVGGPAYSVSSIGHYLKGPAVSTVSVTRRGAGGDAVSVRSAVERADIVHNFGTWTPFNHYVSVTCRRLQKPQVFCPMGMLEAWALSQKRLKKGLGWHLYQKTDVIRSAVVHATATSEAEQLRRIGVKTPIAVIPHGIDLPQGIKPRKRDLQQPLRILFLSRIHPKKGLLDLVAACDQIRALDWQVTIAGPDSLGHTAEVVAAVASIGLQGRFHFVGPVYGTAKDALFKEADLFVLPTYSENFGLVIAEALAYGLPVITTTGAPWQDLQDAGCGWWIKPEIEALREALNEALLRPHEKLTAMGERGRDLVERKYSWRKIIELHVELYNWILHGGITPSFIAD